MRIAESLAKMKLQAVAGEEEVDEALRLFQVSTLDAALSGNLSGVCVMVLANVTLQQTIPVLQFVYVVLTPPPPLLGVEGFTSQEDQEMISRIEKQLKRRFAIGSQVSEHSIVQDFTKQVGRR